jgi:uncharacterized membrane protein
MTELLRGPSLLLAAIASGLQAGLYYGFAVGVMPGLARGDARTFVAAMQQINVAIVNPWFLLTFLGAPALAGLAAALHLGRGPVLGWAIAGFVLALATVVITAAFNIPLNNALDAAGSGDPAAARTAFESGWVIWNAVRALTSTAALGCLAWALALSRT